MKPTSRRCARRALRSKCWSASRAGEAAIIGMALRRHFKKVLQLPRGLVDGGDVLRTPHNSGRAHKRRNFDKPETLEWRELAGASRILEQSPFCNGIAVQATIVPAISTPATS
jgi:hypothetical protein